MALEIGGSAGGYASYRLPGGTYDRLLHSRCEHRCQPDPRLHEEPDWDDLKADGAAKAAVMFGELLAAGEPIIVGAMLARPTTDCPEWLSKVDSRVANRVRVYSDDVCEVADFYSGETLEDGHWELISGAAAAPARVVINRLD